MTTLSQKRTISMFLSLPDIKESASSIEKSIDNLDQNALFSSTSHKPLSIPIYHGSICHIEQHEDNENLCDLIVRVPNVNYSSLPSTNISNIVTSNDQVNEIKIQHETHIKRRAPICPIFKNSLNHVLSVNQNQTNNVDNSNNNQPEINLPLINTKRFAIGLRSLSRAFTANCKAKQSSNVNEITIIPVLPDIEVITENFPIPKLSKKSTKNQNSTSKFAASKIFFIKGKHFRMKQKQTSTVPNNIEGENQSNIHENSATNINTGDNQTEQQDESKQTIPIQVKNQIGQQSKSSGNINTNDPILVKNLEPSSTSGYSSTPLLQSDFQAQIKRNINNIALSIAIPANITQTTSTYMPKEKFCIISNDASSLVHTDNQDIKQCDGDIEGNLYIVHPNGDTFSESYEVTYEFDPRCQNRLNNSQKQINTPIIEGRPSIKFNLDSFEYENLGSPVTSFSKIASNNCNEIEGNPMNQSCQEAKNKIKNVTRVTSHPIENVSQINNDQSTMYQTESISTFSPNQKDDQFVCHGDTPIIYEDYTIILQILKNVLQIDQLLQTETTNMFEPK